MITDLLPNGSGQVTVVLVDAHAVIAAGDADCRQLLGICHRQITHADGVEQLKYRGVGANAQTESEDCNDCEYGSFAQGSQRKAQILPQSLDKRFPSSGADYFFRDLDGPLLKAHCPPGFLTAHPLP